LLTIQLKSITERRNLCLAPPLPFDYDYTYAEAHHSTLYAIYFSFLASIDGLYTFDSSESRLPNRLQVLSEWCEEFESTKAIALKEGQYAIVVIASSEEDKCGPVTLHATVTTPSV